MIAEKIIVGRLLSFWGRAYFQGRTLKKLPGNYTWIFGVWKISGKKNYYQFKRNFTSLEDPGIINTFSPPHPPQVVWPVLKLNLSEKKNNKKRWRNGLQSLRPRCWPRPPLLPNTWPGLPNKQQASKARGIPKLAEKKSPRFFQKKSCFKNSSDGFMVHTCANTMCKIHQLDTCAYSIFIRYSNIHINTIFVTCFFTCANIEYSTSIHTEAPSKGCWYETLRDGEKSHSLRREPFGQLETSRKSWFKNVGHELHHRLLF